MKKHLLIGFIILFSLLFLLPEGVFAGQIPTTELQIPAGKGAPTSSGDYVSSTGGLNTYLSYFIEVPQGSTNLVVELYDADVGNLVPSDIGDKLRTAYNTSVTYTLLRPDGTTEVTLTCNAGDGTGFCVNGNWNNWRTVVNPAAGHWELRVTMGTTGDDLNGFAMRAHDGDSTAGGTEYNIYADSFIPIGVYGVATATYSNIFPFITSGCNFSTIDFDITETGGTGSISVTSRTGAFTQTNSAVSGNDTWLATQVPETGAGWTTDTSADYYGIWSSSISITNSDTGTSGNYTTIYLGNYASAAPPPTTQPQANTFRMYFPTDGGSAPVKPYLTQILTSPIPTATTGKTTPFDLQVTITNPTPYNITFSATNLVTANVPGPTCPAATNSACYVGNSATVTQGAVNSQPANGGTGNITWNPGIVYAGTNASLTYAVNVAPNADGTRIPVTGIPTSNGTRAVYVDETGNTTQTRATYTYGPLCGLAVTSVTGATGKKRFLRWREVFQ
ncbi:MAG: hypothetical protein NTW44_05825 [Nitrospirae bacterium]|nr:hypothetical protein [Nitrospirota bacterium]